MSSLPAIHGMADDRVNVQVNGMSISSSCANHMNPPLSYIAPANVGRVTVEAGITPVSRGGDSIGGSIAVDAAVPEFSRAGDGLLAHGSISLLRRSGAFATSSEGLLPAVVSGQLAAEAILEEADDARRERRYTESLAEGLGPPAAARPGLRPLAAAAGGALLAWPWLTRRVVLDRWFLHRRGAFAEEKSPSGRAFGEGSQGGSGDPERAGAAR